MLSLPSLPSGLCVSPSPPLSLLLLSISLSPLPFTFPFPLSMSGTRCGAGLAGLTATPMHLPQLIGDIKHLRWTLMQVSLTRSLFLSLARSLAHARALSLSRSFSLSRARSLPLSLSHERARALSSFSLSPFFPQPHPACVLTAGALWHGGVRVCSRCTSGRCTAGRTWTS
jgi:hypothetical protein